MFSLNVLNPQKVKIFVKRLQSQFGIEDTKMFSKYLFLKNNKKKVFITTKTEKKDKLHIPRLEKAGIYFATINKDETLRLSLEGSQFVGKHATKNILELDHSQAENWLKGYDFDISVGSDGYYLLKYKEDFLGCGLIRKNKLFNFLPKTRRLKVLYD